MEGVAPAFGFYGLAYLFPLTGTIHEIRSLCTILTLCTLKHGADEDSEQKTSNAASEKKGNSLHIAQQVVWIVVHVQEFVAQNCT